MNGQYDELIGMLVVLVIGLVIFGFTSKFLLWLVLVILSVGVWGIIIFHSTKN